MKEGQLRSFCLVFRVGLVLAALAGMAAGAVSNRIVVTELTGTAQASRPFTIGRVFARGEIRHFAKPVVNGVVPGVWQCDVKTRWRDGVSSCQVTNASNEAPIVIECANHGFQSGDIVRIQGVNGNTAANGTWKITRLSPNKFALQGSAGNGSYSGGGVATGPGPGSVQHAIISFQASLPAGGSVEVSFTDDENPCSAGDAQSCEAAGMDASAILARSWNAILQATQGATVSVSARDLVSQGHYRYWLRGPAVTTIIVEDATPGRTYDFGWTCSSNCSGDYSTATWSPDTTHRSLHPRFILTFYPWWAGVKIEYILENMWTTHLQDQRYDVTLKLGPAGTTTVYSKPGFTHYARTRWRKVFWDGTEPGAVKIDHGREYLSYTGAIPLYDYSLPIGSAEISSVLNNYNPADCDLGGACGITKNFGTTGGRPEIGLLPEWEAYYIYTMSPQLWPVVWDRANASGHVPIHYRESYEGTSPARYFVDLDGDETTKNDPDDNLPGNHVFGRVVSVDARPQWRGPYNLNNTGDDATPAVGALSSGGWAPDAAHQPAFAYLAYLLTGEYYLLEEMHYWSVFNIGLVHEGTSWSASRHGSYGLITYDLQTRGIAWAIRTLGYAIFATPDSMLEKQYLLDKFENSFQALEGRQQIKFGNFFNPLVNAPPDDPCPTSAGSYNGKSYASYSATGQERIRTTPYCWGWRSSTDPAKRGFNPLGFFSEADEYVSRDSDYTSSSLCGRVDSPWQYSFVWAAIGQLRDMGFNVESLLRKAARLALVMGAHPEFNRYLCCTYRMPTWTTDGRHPSDVREFASMYNTAGKTKSSWDNTNDQPCNPGDGYLHYFIGALSYLRGYDWDRTSWQAAWSWYTNQSNVPNAVSKRNNCSPTGRIIPKWAFRPRYEPSRILSLVPTTDGVLVNYKASTTQSCTLAVDTDVGFSSPDATVVDSGGSLARQQVVSGLSPNTSYYLKLSCGGDPFGDQITSFRTAPSSGSVSFSVTVTPPGLMAADAASVEYGPTPALGSESPRASCSTGCTILLSVQRARPLYYRVRYWRSGSVVATSQVRAVVP